jgi:hypothetical protein
VLPARSRGHLEHTVRVFDPFCEVRVRHQAPCGRTRMRDPPFRAVAAIQRSWEHRYLGGARSVGSSPDNDRDGSALPDGQAWRAKAERRNEGGPVFQSIKRGTAPTCGTGGGQGWGVELAPRKTPTPAT